jgi:CheY-like chemotaxis protein
MFSSKQNILVLDSDPQFLIALERLLEEERFSTITTWDVRQAIALLGTAHFDLLLVGDHPPEVKSAELLKRLRSEQSGCPLSSNATGRPIPIRGTVSVHPRGLCRGLQVGAQAYCGACSADTPGLS